MSKGSKQRPTDKDLFDQGWDRIFKKKDPILSEGDKQAAAWLKDEYYDLDDEEDK